MKRDAAADLITCAMALRPVGQNGVPGRKEFDETHEAKGQVVKFAGCWINLAQAAQKRAEEAEAQAAMCMEALENEVLSWGKDYNMGDMHHCPKCNVITVHEVCANCARKGVLLALKNDTGRALLDELRVLRKVADAAKMVRNLMDSFDPCPECTTDVIWDGVCAEHMEQYVEVIMPALEQSLNALAELEAKPDATE